jgi:hypothetical protein
MTFDQNMNQTNIKGAGKPVRDIEDTQKQRNIFGRKEGLGERGGTKR